MKQPLKGNSNIGSANNGIKETRWERIRKKCTGGTPNSLNTETVRRFIEKDYIGKHNRNMLQGKQDAVAFLNPALVMDMRHEMFKKIPRKLPLATVKHHQQKQRQACLDHNIVVEERFIDNELNKLRQQLEKNRRKHTLQVEKRTTMKKDTLLVDNTGLMESLKIVSKHLNDFCRAPLDALDEMEQLVDDGLENDEIDENDDYKEIDFAENFENLFPLDVCTAKPETDLKDFLKTIDDEKLLAETINFQVECRAKNPVIATLPDAEFVRRTPSPLTPTDEFMRPMREAAAKQQAEIRRVHFEDEIGLAQQERVGSSCSNTSDGLDSIISDLAEEALYELQMEEQDQQQQQAIYCNGQHDVQTFDKACPKEQSELIEPTVEANAPLAVVGASAENQTPNPEISPLLITQMKLPTKTVDSNKALVKQKHSSSTDDEEETTSIHEQNLIIEQLFQSRAQTSVSTMRKYFLKWIHYTTITKIERETTVVNKTDRILQINVFLDKIRKEKVRISKMAKEQLPNTENGNGKAAQQETMQMTKKYKNKIKMQQDIIDLQRLKLERQERLILELKLKKLSDEAHEARQEIKNELKTVIRCGDEKSKAKAKCLQLIGNLRDAEDEDEFKRLQGKALLMPKFLQQMQERAIERSIRHEQARQRRLQLEAEKEAHKMALEEAKRLEDEEAKRMRIEALKEKRRLEKMAKILKERENQRMLENKRKAQEFCRRRLLNRIGMEGFKRLLYRKRDYIQKSEALKRKVTKRTFFVAWREYYSFELSRRIQKAENLHVFLVKRRTFNVWCAYVAGERSQYYVAMDWYDMKLSTFMFKEWLGYTRRMRLIEKSKMRKAISHFEWNLKFKVLDCWQRLPQVLRLEKETEERRQRWRMKIWELLPDYTPRLDAFV